MPTVTTVHSLEELAMARPRVALAMGVFDGVHVGHREVIRAAAVLAEKNNAELGVLTFAPHPIQVLAPDKAPRRILASLEHKQQLLAELGVKYLVVQKFSAEFSQVAAEDFIGDVVASCDLCGIAVGEDWRFGRGRGGDGAMLTRLGGEMGFEVRLVAPVMEGGERISSTRIRQAIRDGALDSIRQMLGRPYAIAGPVEKGRQIGRTIGFPTANIDPRTEQLPPAGVWAVRARLGDEILPGVANLGSRPTVEDSPVQRRLEVHLFDFDRDIYGAELVVEFVAFLRGEQRFAGLEELQEQIARDACAARELLQMTQKPCE